MLRVVTHSAFTAGESVLNMQFMWPCLPKQIITVTFLPWENSRHFATQPLIAPRNDVWQTSAEIPYWWRVTTQIWVVLLIGRTAWEIWFNQWYHLNQFKTKWPIQFCYLRLYLDIETVSCRLLPQRARMDMDWKSWANCFSSFNAMLAKITKKVLRFIGSPVKFVWYLLDS